MNEIKPSSTGKRQRKSRTGKADTEQVKKDLSEPMGGSQKDVTPYVIEVGGVEWTVLEAVSRDEAMNAINMARATGSLGRCERISDEHGNTSVLADVYRFPETDLSEPMGGSQKDVTPYVIEVGQRSPLFDAEVATKVTKGAQDRLKHALLSVEDDAIPETDLSEPTGGSQRYETPYYPPVIDDIAAIGDTLLSQYADESDHYVIAVRKFQAAIRENGKSILNKLYGRISFDERLGVPFDDTAPEKDLSEPMGGSRKDVTPYTGLTKYDIEQSVASADTQRTAEMIKLALAVSMIKSGTTELTITPDDLGKLKDYIIDYDVVDGVTVMRVEPAEVKQ